MAEAAPSAQKRLSFAEIDSSGAVWEYAALVTSLSDEILTRDQLYRDRADCENTYDELKNHWGWGGFTTHDLKCCRLLAGVVALIYNWWSLFVRLAEPDHHREAITTRPLSLAAVARQTHHAGQVKLTISSAHAREHCARRAYLRIARFLAGLRNSAEQLDQLQRSYRISVRRCGTSSRAGSWPHHVGSTRPNQLLWVVCISNNQAEAIPNCRFWVQDRGGHHCTD